ncbi:MAG TPA: MFS transporter [Acidimicrobiales bacterium]|jgi:MFS family permease|nr:MFS transporter [Acidimicrobiales bacterium]
MKLPGNRGGTAGPEHGFDSPEAIEAEAMLSGGGAGAEGGIVVPWPLLFRHRMHTKVRTSDRYQWWVLWTVLAGLLSVNITFTVFVVALPQVAHQLHTSVSTLTWTSTGPLLAFGVAAPVLGKLGDIGGYRRLYMWGLLGAAVCVILTATAPNAGVLIGARLLDGVEGAATGAASMALMLQVFSNEDRVKAMGWWALVGAGGPVIGVTVGAPIIQYFGWRALFWGELPLMAMAAVLAFIVLPGPGQLHPGATPADVDPGVPAEPAYSPWRHLDWTGSFTLAASVTAGLLALNLAPAHGFTSPLILGIFGVSIAAGVWFVAQEQRTDHPLIPLRYFRMRNFTFPLAAKALTNFSYMGGFFLFPLLMEGIYGYSETRAGLVSTARPLLFSVIAPVAGYTAVVIGERISTVVGTLTLAGSMVVFTQIGVHPSLVVILIALALSGAGIGIATPSTTASSSNEVDLDELGVMSAAQQLVTQVGVVAGIQVMVTVQASSRGGVGSLASFHRAYLVGLVVALAATVCAFFMRNTPRPGRGKGRPGRPRRS